MWLQKELRLKPRARGFHLITDELLRELPELRNVRIGMMNVFIKSQTSQTGSASQLILQTANCSAAMPNA